VNIRRIVHSDVFDDLKSVRFMAGRTLSFGGPKNTIKVLDVKFVDDEHFMLLVKEGGKS
jgi:hypothetical protein